MNLLITQINTVLTRIGFGPLLVVAILIGLYFYWWLSRKKGKDVNSIFDLWITGFIAMLIWGRLSYIISYWFQFENLAWFYIPYEKYANQVYLFRLLPWKFFAIWDGGVLFTGMILAFLLSSFLFIVVIKKWSWKEMLKPVLASTSIMLGLIFAIYGVFILDINIIIGGIILTFSVLIFTIDNGGNPLIGSIYSIVSSLFISYIFLIEDITFVDKVNVVFLVVTGVFMAIWYFRSFFGTTGTGSKRNAYDIHTATELQTNKAIKIRK